MPKLLTSGEFLLLAGFCLALITAFSVYGSARLRATAAGYFLNNRQTSVVLGAVACFAAWTWAPAYFISSQFGYQYGWVGAFWYIPVNALCLAIFAFAAYRITQLNPLGYTLAEYMGIRYSPRVQNLYLLAHGALGISAYAVQVLAGAGVIAYMTPIPYFWASVGLAFAPIVYTMFGGLRASIISDNVKGWMLIAVLLIIVPWLLVKAGGIDVLSKGLYGKTGEYVSPFEGDKSWLLMLTFGIPASLNWLAGPWRDQSFWQLAYAGDRRARRNQFLLAAPLFALVVFGLCLIGIIAAGTSTPIANPQYANIEIVRNLLPWPVAVFFAAFLVLGLVSTLDSHIVSVATLFGNDVYRRRHPDSASDQGRVRYSQAVMVILPVITIAIANIPGLKIIHLFLIYGSLGAATFLPTVISLVFRHLDSVSESGMYWGILASLTIGWPLAIAGYFLANPTDWMGPAMAALKASLGEGGFKQLTMYLPIIGAITTMAASGIIVAASGLLARNRASRTMLA